ncbi:hypothetical protein GGS23DRAFT_595127 [Durotheca rogersii]|uniref:uncharacterized protein n=1 Tax=Durotheca rogersii TaxID=419775 RepID=UPI00221E61E9|nr:uncharacterized protein GGS23DRAFT_595127 [Durotheca rogersii]KAI5865608.1 hypothetical protein GGS23DRAFT_595127 [Durotheca rogersii]
MKTYTLITFASPILAAVVKDPASVLEAQASSGAKYLGGIYDKHRLEDVQILCGAPPNVPDSVFPATDYDHPVGILLSGGDKRLHVEAGPSKCIQAACDTGGGAGVFICNDETHPIDPLYADIGWFAQQVYFKCRDRRGDQDFVHKGQAFNPDDKWNVILNDVGPDCTASSLPDQK